jgi:hypothetical protein
MFTADATSHRSQLLNEYDHEASTKRSRGPFALCGNGPSFMYAPPKSIFPTKNSILVKINFSENQFERSSGAGASSSHPLGTVLQNYFATTKK